MCAEGMVCGAITHFWIFFRKYVILLGRAGTDKTIMTVSMTRFTRCESSPSFPVIVVRSALPCHRTAPEKVTGRTGKRYQKGSGRAPEGFLKGRGTGARRGRGPHLPFHPPLLLLPPRTNTTTSVAILPQGQHALSASSRLQWSYRLRTRRQRRSVASQGATTPCLDQMTSRSPF